MVAVAGVLISGYRRPLRDFGFLHVPPPPASSVSSCRRFIHALSSMSWRFSPCTCHRWLGLGQAAGIAAMKLTSVYPGRLGFSRSSARGNVLRGRRHFSGSGAEVFEAASQRGSCRPIAVLQLELVSSRWLRQTARLESTAGIGAEFRQVWFHFMFMGRCAGWRFPLPQLVADGHVAAPNAVSMIHAGVLMKVGAFAHCARASAAPEGADITCLDGLLDAHQCLYGAPSLPSATSNMSSASHPSATWGLSAWVGRR